MATLNLPCSQMTALETHALTLEFKKQANGLERPSSCKKQQLYLSGYVQAYTTLVFIMGIIYQNPVQEGDFSWILNKHRAGVLAFMHDFRILFDSDLVERDVRMIRAQHKVSGCFRTLNGAHILCANRSCISTALKHDLNAIDAIQKAFLAQSFIPSAIQA